MLLLSISAVLGLGCGSFQRPESRIGQVPTIDEGMGGALSGEIQVLKIRHFKDSKVNEFYVGGDKYSCQLVDSLFKSYQMNLVRWQSMPENAFSSEAKSNWFVGITFKKENFRRGNDFLQTNFGFYIPHDEGRYLSSESTSLLAKLEALASKSKDHFYGN